MIINGQRYDAEPAVEAYVKELEQENAKLQKDVDRLDQMCFDMMYKVDELKAENEYHIAKIKSMHQEFKGLLRTPAWEYDRLQAMKELEAENKQLKQQLAELSSGGAKDEES